VIVETHRHLRDRLFARIRQIGGVVLSMPLLNRWYIAPRNRYDLIPKDQYDYVPKGTYVYGPASHFLLVPKNRYHLSLLPGMEVSDQYGVGWITEENTSSSYDLLWGEDSILESFRMEGGHVRDKLTEEIVDHIERWLPVQGNIVDIGCGVGDLLAEVHRRCPGATLHGLDFSAKAIEKARARFHSDSFLCHVLHQDIPYPSHEFDVVLCTDVLEHLEYPKRIVEELVRICRPGGMVVIVVPDGDIDQFFGHNWFWNQGSLDEFLADWRPQVIRLPITREFLACLQVSDFPP
jgi:SAM-dependent methyltransferase